MKHRSLAGLSLRDLEYATTIAQQGHFGKAADICGVSQPAISQQIQKLEALLGVVLFERQGRRIVVTRNGRAVLDQAEELLALARGLYETAAAVTDPFVGELHMGAIPTLGPYLMPQILPAIRTAHPALSMRLYEHTTDQLTALLSQRKIDLALLSTPLPAQVSGERLTTAPLFFEPFVLACPEDHPLAHRTDLGPLELAQADLLMLSEEHCMRDQTLALCRLRGANTPHRLASSLEMLRQMVASGEGCTLLPRLAVSGLAPRRSLLRTIPIATKGFGRTVALAWRNRDPRAEAFQGFADFITAQMQTPEIQPLLSPK